MRRAEGQVKLEEAEHEPLVENGEVGPFFLLFSNINDSVLKGMQQEERNTNKFPIAKMVKQREMIKVIHTMPTLQREILHYHQTYIIPGLQKFVSPKSSSVLIRRLILFEETGQAHLIRHLCDFLNSSTCY